MKIVIHHGLIIDGTGRSPKKGDIWIEDGLISTVGSSALSLNGADQVIDANGQCVIPGLINCHVHLTANASHNSLRDMQSADPCEATIIGVTVAQKLLKSGITTVRDMGSKHYEVIAIREAIQKGLISGPAILTAGRALLMTGGHFLGLEVDGVDACLAGTRSQIRAGADFIKVVATGGLGKVPGAQELTYEEMRACFEVALRAGKTCAAHAHGTSGIKDAVRAGVTSIEHGTLLDEEAMDMMIERETYLVPTFAAYSRIVKHGEEKGVPGAIIQSSHWVMEEKRPRFRDAVKKGVHIAFGTDGGSPINSHENIVEECRCMLEGGMAPMEVILSLTQNASRLLRSDSSVGTLEPGKQADIVLLGGNPLENVEELANVVAVIKKGQLAYTYPESGSRRD
jgi:imidazolonepropionase-like amidohydrolase